MSSHPTNLTKTSALLGGVLCNTFIGAVYSWGSINSYMASYLHFEKDSWITPEDTLVIYSLWLLFQTIGALFSLSLGNKFGYRLTAFVAYSLVSLNILSTSWTIHINFYLFTFQFGVLNGLLIGTTFFLPLYSCWTYFPLNKGLATGVNLFSGGISSIILNNVMMLAINPENQEPIQNSGSSELYFGEAVYARVPFGIRIVALLLLSFGIFGAFLLREPWLTEKAFMDQKEDSKNSEKLSENIQMRISMTTQEFPEKPKRKIEEPIPIRGKEEAEKNSKSPQQKSSSPKNEMVFPFGDDQSANSGEADFPKIKEIKLQEEDSSNNPQAQMASGSGDTDQQNKETGYTDQQNKETGYTDQQNKKGPRKSLRKYSFDENDNENNMVLNIMRSVHQRKSEEVNLKQGLFTEIERDPKITAGFIFMQLQSPSASPRITSSKKRVSSQLICQTETLQMLAFQETELLDDLLVRRAEETPNEMRNNFLDDSLLMLEQQKPKENVKEFPSFKQALLSTQFLLVFVMALTGSIYNLFLSAIFKDFGFESNPLVYRDLFLTEVGSAGSLANAFARLLMGFLLDYLSPKWLYFGVLLFQILCSISLHFLHTNPPAYALLIIIGFFGIGAHASIFPSVSLQIWGFKHGPRVFSFIHFSLALSSVFGLLILFFSRSYSLSNFVMIGTNSFSALLLFLVDFRPK